MPGINRVAEDVAEDIDEAVLSGSLLWKVQLQDIPEFLRLLVVDQRCADYRVIPVGSVALVGAILLRLRTEGVVVSGSDEGNQKIFDCAEKLMKRIIVSILFSGSPTFPLQHSMSITPIEGLDKR